MDRGCPIIKLGGGQYVRPESWLMSSVIGPALFRLRKTRGSHCGYQVRSWNCSGVMCSDTTFSLVFVSLTASKHRRSFLLAMLSVAARQLGKMLLEAIPRIKLTAYHAQHACRRDEVIFGVD